MISRRLRQLRLARSLTLEMLAAKAGGIVTKQAISKYERGTATPSPVVLNRLASALGVKAAHLWAEPRIAVEFLAFRKRATLGRKEQSRIEAVVSEELEARVRLQELVQPEYTLSVPVHEFQVAALDDCEDAAQQVRERWQLGTDTVASVTGVLENHLVHVMEIESHGEFDGMSAIAKDDRGRAVAAAVVARTDVCGERQRFSLAHELGHLVLEVQEDAGRAFDHETAAHRFAAAFLAPKEMIRREVGVGRSRVEVGELLVLKGRLGMSIQALLYRLHDLGLISQHHYHGWCKEVSRRGWRRQEPSELRRETPQWLLQNVHRAHAEKLISRDEVERLLKHPAEGDTRLSLERKRAFMKLPMEERRRILAEEAERLCRSYEQNTEWEAFQEGDLVEH